MDKKRRHKPETTSLAPAPGCMICPWCLEPHPALEAFQLTLSQTQGSAEQRPNRGWRRTTGGGMKVQSGRIERIEAFELVLRMEPCPFKPHLYFAKNGQACESLVTEAIIRDQPVHEVEARFGERREIRKSLTLLS